MVIRKATPQDAAAMLALIQELAVYEQEPNAVRLGTEELIADGWTEPTWFHCLVAESSSKLVGMALSYPAYSTWNGKAWYLEDLIVTEAQRGNGIGSALLEATANLGLEHGARLMRWQVLDWNVSAIKFYEALEARIEQGWWNVRLDEHGMQQLTKKTS